MANLLDFNKTLFLNPQDAAYANTYLGQAHVAGTGANGATCRLCKYWGNRGGHEIGYYSNSHKTLAGCLKEASCLYPIPGKAARTFPHYANACKFFERTDAPYPMSRPNR